MSSKSKTNIYFIHILKGIYLHCWTIEDNFLKIIEDLSFSILSHQCYQFNIHNSSNAYSEINRIESLSFFFFTFQNFISAYLNHQNSKISFLNISETLKRIRDTIRYAQLNRALSYYDIHT